MTHPPRSSRPRPLAFLRLRGRGRSVCACADPHFACGVVSRSCVRPGGRLAPAPDRGRRRARSRRRRPRAVRRPRHRPGRLVTVVFGRGRLVVILVVAALVGPQSRLVADTASLLELAASFCRPPARRLRLARHRGRLVLRRARHSDTPLAPASPAGADSPSQRAQATPVDRAPPALGTAHRGLAARLSGNARPSRCDLGPARSDRNAGASGHVDQATYEPLALTPSDAGRRHRRVVSDP